MKHGHSNADARNLALHRLALSRLKASPVEGTRKVLETLDRWLSLPYLKRQEPLFKEWKEALKLPFEDLASRILSESGQQLRQCSPLGVLITAQERFAVYRELSQA